MKYRQLTDGDYEVPVMRGYRLMCCGCSQNKIVDQSEV